MTPNQTLKVVLTTFFNLLRNLKTMFSRRLSTSTNSKSSRENMKSKFGLVFKPKMKPRFRKKLVNGKEISPMLLQVFFQLQALLGSQLKVRIVEQIYQLTQHYILRKTLCKPYFTSVPGSTPTLSFTNRF
jgi:hypothetical protein